MSYRVLVVDDTHFMRKMSTDYLKQYGYLVAGEATNGREAVAQYESLRPDFVMMDLTMPEMNGIDAIKEILKIDPQAVVLVCSASNQQNLIFDALDLGAKGYLMKPFKPDHMNDIIRKYALPHIKTQDVPSLPEDALEEKVNTEIAATLEFVQESYTGNEKAMTEIEDTDTAEETIMEKPIKLRQGFVTSYMCSWQEEMNGADTGYSVVCTEHENKLVVEMNSAGQEKQTIQFTLEGFRELNHWLNQQLVTRTK